MPLNSSCISFSANEFVALAPQRGQRIAVEAVDLRLVFDANGDAALKEPSTRRDDVVLKLDRRLGEDDDVHAPGCEQAPEGGGDLLAASQRNWPVTHQAEVIVAAFNRFSACP